MSQAEQEEARPDTEMAFKEYQILEKAADRGTSLNYTVAGIFVGGLFTALAILIPKVAQQNCGLELLGYLVASVAILLCTWFWFCGIYLIWRTRTAIMFHRLQELEEFLGFDAHRRIELYYKSLGKEYEWPEGKEPLWYEKLSVTLARLTPSGPNATVWWHRIIVVITVALIMVWLFPLGRCVWSSFHCLSGSIP